MHGVIQIYRRKEEREVHIVLNLNRREGKYSSYILYQETRGNVGSDTHYYK